MVFRAVVVFFAAVGFLAAVAGFFTAAVFFGLLSSFGAAFTGSLTLMSLADIGRSSVLFLIIFKY